MPDPGLDFETKVLKRFDLFPVRSEAGGLVFKAHRLSYDSTLGSRVIKKKKKESGGEHTIFLISSWSLSIFNDTINCANLRISNRSISYEKEISLEPFF